MTEPFSTRLHARQLELGSSVCVGLDPRPDHARLTDPTRLGARPWEAKVVDAVKAHLAAVLEATSDVAAACKPQAAFFEAMGPLGIAALSDLIRLARDLGVLVILDAKRGDIGSTAEAYAEAYLADGPLGSDALTVNPFLGLDTLTPLLAAAEGSGRGLYVLVRTSNPGSRDLQGLELATGGSVAEHLARRLAQLHASCATDERGYSALGAVAGSPSDLAAVRATLPGSPLLVPGYGAQGAGAADVAPAFDAAGLGAVVNSSRGILYPGGASEAGTLEELVELSRGAAIAMREDLRRATLTASGDG